MVDAIARHNLSTKPPSVFPEKIAFQLKALVDRKTTSVLLALSGGADSTSLVVALAEVRTKFAFKLRVGHVNHCLRGAESDHDEQFCRDLCRKLDLPIDVVRLSEDKVNGCGKSEENLRQLRYEALSQICLENNCDAIVTAHTLDDQVETMLFRLFRGTSLRGLSAMKRRRDLKLEIGRDIALLRPMLTLRRDDCLEFLRLRSIEFRTDSSNDNLDYSRNFIRHELKNRIESEFPGFSERLGNLRNLIESEDELLDQLARERLAALDSQTEGSWEQEHFLSLPIAFRRRVVALALAERNIEVSYERVEKILSLTIGFEQTTYSLDENWDIGIRGDNLVWLKKNPEGQSTATQFSEVRLRVPGRTIIPAIAKVFQIEPWQALSFDGAAEGQRHFFSSEESMEALVDLEKVELPLVFRTRKPGDVIQPFGMKDQVRLKQYLHSKRAAKKGKGLTACVVADSLADVLVLADNHEVLWVPGVGISEKLRVTKNPSHRLRLLDIAPDPTHIV